MWTFRKASEYILVLLLIHIAAASGYTTIVCGSDGGTYSYEGLVAAQRYQPNLKLVRHGSCTGIEQELSEIYKNNDGKVKQLCGNDGRTYGSELEILLESLIDPNLDVLHWGPCKGIAELEATLRIPSVCASDAQTYDTYRQFLLARFKQHGLKMGYKGSCLTEFQRQTKPYVFFDDTLLRRTGEICGTDLNTYIYEEFEQDRFEKSNLNILHKGPCVLVPKRKNRTVLTRCSDDSCKWRADPAISDAGRAILLFTGSEDLFDSEEFERENYNKKKCWWCYYERKYYDDPEASELKKKKTTRRP